MGVGIAEGLQGQRSKVKVICQILWRTELLPVEEEIICTQSLDDGILA